MSKSDDLAKMCILDSQSQALVLEQLFEYWAPTRVMGSAVNKIQ